MLNKKILLILLSRLNQCFIQAPPLARTAASLIKKTEAFTAELAENAEKENLK